MLNGSLVGSILSRLKIGKPLIIKNPSNEQQLTKNWEEINKICILRGYETFRKKFLAEQESFEVMMGLLGDFKKEYEKQNKHSRRNSNLEVEKNCGACDHSLFKKKEIGNFEIEKEEKQSTEKLKDRN